MIFGQLTARDSMRDLMLSLEAHRTKYYHLGFGPTLTRRNLGKSNCNRDYRIFEDFAYTLMKEARSSFYKNDFQVGVQGNVYAFDSTTVDLCLNVFWWAEFRKHKAGIKLHTLFDVKTSIPCFLLITNAKVHDVNILDSLKFEQGSFYIIDRGYLDFDRLFKINQQSAYFVTRGKSNFKFTRMYSRAVDKSKGILCDQIGRLEKKSLKAYPAKIRRLKFYDQELGREFVFITNNMELEASEIAQLYKNRWSVELFFKWIKQHLKVKTFWGTTMNAVKIQVYSAVITYCLVAIAAYKLKVERPIYEILQILSIFLLDKTFVNEILKQNDYKNINELNPNQLKISWD
jgi:hypothetical protein